MSIYSIFTMTFAVWKTQNFADVLYTVSEEREEKVSAKKHFLCRQMT